MESGQLRVSGYFHNLSDITTSASDCKYFTSNFQEQTKITPFVCFKQAVYNQLKEC